MPGQSRPPVERNYAFGSHDPTSHSQLLHFTTPHPECSRRSPPLHFFYSAQGSISFVQCEFGQPTVKPSLFQNLTAGAGSKKYGMYFSFHGHINRCNSADFLLFLHANGKNPFHIALNQRHPLVFGTVLELKRGGFDCLWSPPRTPWGTVR